MEKQRKSEEFVSRHKYFDFVTPSLMRMLGLFLSKPASKYHIRELAKILGASPAFVSKNIGSLVKIGILDFYRMGQMKIYGLNPTDPLAKQLKIVMNVYHLKPFLDITKGHSDRIVLFGSCSSGTDSEDSDVDVFVVVKNGRDGEILKQAMPVLDATGRKISVIIADPQEMALLEEKDKAFYNNIKRGITLWDRIEDL